MPMPVWPLLFQSPATGKAPAKPYWNTPASGAPALASLRRNQVKLLVSKAPMPIWPAAGGPALLAPRRNQVCVAGLNTPTVSFGGVGGTGAITVRVAVLVW